MKKKELTWKDARYIARLSKEDVEMAKELNLKPETIIRNAKTRKSEPWKDSPSVYIRKMYDKRFK